MGGALRGEDLALKMWWTKVKECLKRVKKGLLLGLLVLLVVDVLWVGSAGLTRVSGGEIRGFFSVQLSFVIIAKIQLIYPLPPADY